MRLSFDNIDEVREFVKGLKGTRGGKGGDTDDAGPSTGGQPGNTAPAPLNPPTATAAGFPGAGAAGFSPPGGGSFPGAGATGPSAEVLALVNRIAPRIDAVIAGGQPADNVLSWFRQQCGPEAANATMDQIKQVLLPKASVPALQEIAKLIAA